MSKKKATTTDAALEQGAPEPAASPMRLNSAQTLVVPEVEIGPGYSATVAGTTEGLPEHMRDDPYWAAIQEVLADPDYDHRGAHHTEHLAIRKLVEGGHDEAEATAEVRRRLY